MKTALKMSLAVLLASIGSTTAQLALDQIDLDDLSTMDALVPVFDNVADVVVPFRMDSKTGDLLTADGKLVNDPDLNGAERKQERLFSAWAIENPREFWKAAKPVHPPKTDPTAPDFDIKRPEMYAAAMRAKETDEERQLRNLASLAIVDPIAYESKLKVEEAKKSPKPAGASEPVKTGAGEPAGN